MAHTAEISRINPSAFLFLIDQSGSMQDWCSTRRTCSVLISPCQWTGARILTRHRAAQGNQGVADAINKLLQNLVIKCNKDDGVRNYYHVGVVGVMVA